MKAVCEIVLERWFTAKFRQKEPTEVERVRQMLLATKPTGYIGCSTAIRDMDQRDLLGTIETPVFVIIGRHDPATTPEAGEYIVTRVPGAQKAVLDAAHLSNIEQPEAFNSAVLSFFTGQKR
jgi:3-oxoadipate enol-lactonase